MGIYIILCIDNYESIYRLGWQTQHGKGTKLKRTLITVEGKKIGLRVTACDAASVAVAQLSSAQLGFGRLRN